MTQFVASSFGELGVQSQYLDGELHLVDDALSVGLVARPEFEVRKAVVEAVAILVMYAFKFGQRATKMFRHCVTVFQHFAAAPKVEHHVSGRMHVAFGVDRAPRATFIAAFFAAEFLTHVVSAGTTVLKATHTTFFRYATQLALKSRSGFLVHIGQLPGSIAAVKGVV